MEPTVPPPRGIDLGAKQRAIITQIQADEDQLVQLRREIEAATARLHASRGKLDLIAELAQALQVPVVTTSDDAPPAGAHAHQRPAVAEGSAG